MVHRADNLNWLLYDESWYAGGMTPSFRARWFRHYYRRRDGAGQHPFAAFVWSFLDAVAGR